VRREAVKAAPKGEQQRFFLKAFILIVLIGFIYWAGWRSKWARADSRVVVEAVDAPKPVATSVPVVEPAPPATDKSVGEADSASSDEGQAAGADTHDEPVKPKKKHHSKKQKHAPPVQDNTPIELD
jgi:hypothetical protein